MATTITANGINFPDGSAGSPSIGGSDTNTGLFTGSDIVGFATGGSERLRIDASGNVNIANDSGKLQLGTSNDFKIYHNGTKSIIDNNTGDLSIETTANEVHNVQSEFQVKVKGGDEDGLKVITDGAVELYYDNSKKLETTNSGGTLYGDWLADANFLLADSDKIKLGNAADLQIYHDGTHSRITNSTGFLALQSDSFRLYNAAGSENMINGTANGAVELYYDNVKHFETTSIGCKLSDNDTTAALQFANSAGDNGYVMAESTNIIGFKDSQAHWLVKAFRDGAVELYHDNLIRLETNTVGITVTSESNTPIVQFEGASNNAVGKIDCDQVSPTTSHMRFYTETSGSLSEKMRIDSDGSVFIGTTSAGNTGAYFQNDSGSRKTLNIGSSSTSTQNQIIFRNSNGRVGHIQTSGTSTSYNTSFSDRDAKKNFENWDEDVLTLFKSINAQKFNFKVEDDSAIKSKGFIAQEMIDKFPEAYQKEEGDLYQFNPSGMVVYLMKALQEAVSRIEALEAA